MCVCVSVRTVAFCCLRLDACKFWSVVVMFFCVVVCFFFCVCFYLLCVCVFLPGGGGVGLVPVAGILVAHTWEWQAMWLLVIRLFCIQKQVVARIEARLNQHVCYQVDVRIRVKPNKAS